MKNAILRGIPGFGILIGLVLFGPATMGKAVKHTTLKHTTLKHTAPATVNAREAGNAASNQPMDLPVYTDSFVSGWINYGWAAIAPDNAAPVHSGSASLRVSAGAFDGLHIHHAALDSRMFQSVSFWINGGPVGGQNLKVGVYLGGTLQPAFVPVGPLPPGLWQHITVPLASLGAADKPDVTGLFIGSIEESARPAYYLDDIALKASPPPSTVTVAVDAGTTLQKADDRLFGVNIGAWEGAFTSRMPLLKEIDNKALRFPGGSLADSYHWSTGETTTNGEAKKWDLSFDAFARGARSTQAQVYITVNYGSGTAQDAADWVKYANVTRNYGFQYWEIGNECNLTAERDTHARPHDPYTYALHASEYIRRMKAVAPNINVGVVIGGNEEGEDNGYSDHPATNPRTGQTHHGWDPVVLTTLHSLGLTPDFVIYHRYIYLGGQEHDTSLLLSSFAWETEIARIRRMLADYLGADAAKVEIAVTEHNSTASAPGKQTTSLVNGLFLADSVGYASRTELRALLWWQLSDDRLAGNQSASLYGWRDYGGYGIMARVPAADPAFEVYPTFYIYKMLRHFARGGDAIVKAGTNFPLLSAYAARRADGSLSVLIINKSASSTYRARVSVTGYAPGPSATVYSYGIVQDTAARTHVGSPDLARTLFTKAGTSFRYDFAPYSATLISLSPRRPHVAALATRRGQTRGGHW